MAVRYSGDVEIRVLYDPRRQIYAGVIRTRHGEHPASVDPRRFRDRRSSEAYDDAARRTVLAVEKRLGRRLLVERRYGQVIVRRGFRSPCPLLREGSGEGARPRSIRRRRRMLS